MSTIRVSFIYAIFVIFVCTVECLPNVIRVGGLFTIEEEEQELAFRFAIERINNEKILQKTTLVAIVERIGMYDSFHAYQKGCGLLRNGVVAIVGPLDHITSMQVQSICDDLEIPHIETRLNIDAQRSAMSINLYPLPSVMTNIYIELVKELEWEGFGIVYQENWGLFQFRDFFKQTINDKWNVTIYQFLEDMSYREVFKKVKQNQQFNIILDVKDEDILDVLKQAQQVGVLTDEYHYLFTSLNLHTFDLSDYTVSGAKLTSFKIVSESSADHEGLRNDWISYATRLGRRNFLTPPKHFLAESALIYDSIKLLAYSLKELDTISDVNQVSCENEKQWTDGSSLINYMKQFGGKEGLHEELVLPVLKSFFGITELIEFDNFGFRSNFKLEIIANTIGGYETTGYWLGDKLVKQNEIWDKYYKIALWNNEVIYITTAKNEPFFMEKESTDELTGNDKYEGYVVDLVDKLAERFGFKYVIRMARDGKYGDNATGVWNGMIGEIRNGTADIAVADLTITSERESAVDFTYPFMNTGITILYKKPTTKVTSLWAFLSPFSSTVWNYMLGACVGITFLLFFIGRFTPYEWQNPHPCRQDNQVLENVLKSRNSFWVAIGSLMQQGCDIAPKALSTRLITATWYFFTLIIIASYTANLAAFLTTEKIPYPFENVDGLANQTKIKYGCKNGGATHRFFQNSKIPTYKKINEFMNKNPDVFLEGAEQDYERVERESGKYAVFVESARNEYITQRYCNMTQIGSPLDNKGYGIATKMGDKRRSELSEEIVRLQETGELQKLKDKWWTQKRGGGACVSKPTQTIPKLGISNVGGVFIVLIVGSVIALCIAIIEFIYKTHIVNKNMDITFGAALLNEIKFALTCQSQTKIVKRKSDKSLSGSKKTLSGSKKTLSGSKTGSTPRLESQISAYY